MVLVHEVRGFHDVPVLDGVSNLDPVLERPKVDVARQAGLLLELLRRLPETL
jgi:hypothetical protein